MLPARRRTRRRAVGGRRRASRRAPARRRLQPGDGRRPRLALDRRSSSSCATGRACSTVPAHSIRRTNGWALPSIAGTSGPLISTSTLSISQAASAAIRCSIIRTVAATPATRHGDAVGGRRMVEVRQRIAGAARAVDAAEPDARALRRRAEREADPGAAVEADAGAADHVTKCPLLPHPQELRAHRVRVPPRPCRRPLAHDRRTGRPCATARACRNEERPPSPLPGAAGANKSQVLTVCYGLQSKTSH